MASPMGEEFVVIPPNYTITLQPRQALPVPEVQPSPNLNRFLQAQPKALGVVQIMIGLMHLGCWYGMADVSRIGSSSIVVALGSLFYIISGSYSVAAENKLTRTRVKCSLGMNIISFPVAVFEILIIIREYYASQIKRYESQLLQDICGSGKGFKLGALASLILFIILEIGIILSTSAFACKVLCCNTDKPPVSLPLETVQTVSSTILPEKPYEVLTSSPAEYSTLQ